MDKFQWACGIIILAAGLGKRMKSDRAKVLHEIMGRAMVLYVTDTAAKIAGDEVIVVIGHQAEEVRKAVSKTADVRFALQEKQLGTGHAVACAVPFLSDRVQQVVILYGDVPLLRVQTLETLLREHIRSGCDLTVLTVDMADPTGYGRILTDENGQFTGIVEEADASVSQRRIRTINTGIYCVGKGFLAETLPQIRAQNAQGEYYLTDIVDIGHRSGRLLGTVQADDPEEVVGVNSLQDLERVRQILQRRLPSGSVS